MITINGTFTLCSDVHVAFTSTSDVQLTLTATAPHPTDPNGPAYKLVWLGDRAAQFHAEFEHALKIGTRMTVIATDPRPMIDRGDLCILANVLDIQAHARQADTLTKARPQSRWVNLPGVAA